MSLRDFTEQELVKELRSRRKARRTRKGKALSHRSSSIDVERTTAANFLDRRSFWHRNGHVYLKGKDASAARDRISMRDRGICQLQLEGCRGLAWRGELEHKQGGFGLQRCWCDHNLRWSCKPCHAKKHGRVIRSDRAERAAQ